MLINFSCPNCLSYMFGSIRNKDGTYTRHCNGNREWKCNFIFHENMDPIYLKDPHSDKKIHHKVAALWL